MNRCDVVRNTANNIEFNFCKIHRAECAIEGCYAEPGPVASVYRDDDITKPAGVTSFKYFDFSQYEKSSMNLIKPIIFDRWEGGADSDEPDWMSECLDWKAITAWFNDGGPL